MIADVKAGVENDASVFGRFLVPGDHDSRTGVCPADLSEDLGDEVSEDGIQGLMAEPGGSGRSLCDSDGFGGLDCNVDLYPV